MIPGKIHASTAGKSIIDNKNAVTAKISSSHSANMVLIHKSLSVTFPVYAL
jgi:phosphopantetheinyl transferase